jgi:mitochondrial import inner membrane translocase subunit TIM23
VAALAYNAINSSIDGIRGKHDVFGSMAAGAFSGAIYKSTGSFMLMNVYVYTSIF